MSETPAIHEVECGSDEEIELRGTWLSRLMFGGLVGIHEHRTYEQWLDAIGVRLSVSPEATDA